ncbi:MAG: sigma-70 family RNA polymerase sigma factor [Planctomycetota bacterium]
MAHHPGSSFPTTNWNEIGRLETPEFAAAMTELCQQYWYPIYVFVRRRCGDQHRAEDVTQAFFAKVLAKRTFRHADPSRGRFRSFLLTSVRNFIADDHAAEQTHRRGGGKRVVSIDCMTAEQLYQRNQNAEACPEDEFDRAWAITLMEHAITRLQNEYQAKNQSRRFELLVPTLRSATLDHEAIAEELEIDEVAARKAASRFRQRYGRFLREEIAATLSETGDLKEEIAWMMRLFSR